MVFSAFCKWGTEAQKWGVTHPKSQHPRELAVEVIVRTSLSPRTASLVCPDHPLQAVAPRALQKCCRHFRSSISLPSPLPLLFPFQPSISSLPNTDVLHI